MSPIPTIPDSRRDRSINRRTGFLRHSDFGFRISVLLSALLIAHASIAQDPSTQPSAQVTQGARMKLLPPKPSILDTQDPLEEITNQMTDVVGELASLKTDKPVQGKQQEVVDNLDAIIKLLEQQKSGNGSSGSLNPTKPMNDSRIAGGPGGIHDLRDPRAGTRNFGTLPPRERDAILQSKTEGFPPGYESLLQSYYQRLAQEKLNTEGAVLPAKP